MQRLSKKICLLGDFFVGKTSLVRRFVEGRFGERYLSTIGVKVDRKELLLPLSQGTASLTLMIWDLAGGLDVGPAVPAYYRGAAGAIVVCDLTRPETLSSVGHYIDALRKPNPDGRVVLAANKVDLVEQRLLSDEALVQVASLFDVPLFLTSAKTGEQVEAMFRQLGRLLLG